METELLRLQRKGQDFILELIVTAQDPSEIYNSFTLGSRKRG